MSDDTKLIERKPTELLREKSQYAAALGVIALILWIANFPTFVIVFFGILAFFIWRTLASPAPNGTREIFEFFLQANDILRDDDRRWYGFEIQEVIARGERIIKAMKGAPPLVYFAVGALYHKIGDHKSAEQHLAYIAEGEGSDERTFVYPSPELRAYVKTLRKIEREPAESPLTSTAVRALERARRNRTKSLLESSRDALRLLEFKKVELELDSGSLNEHGAPTANGGRPLAPMFGEPQRDQPKPAAPEPDASPAPPASAHAVRAAGAENHAEEPYRNRKTISEVLRDIYDTK